MTTTLGIVASAHTETSVTLGVVGFAGAVLTASTTPSVTISAGTDGGGLWVPAVNDLVVLIPSSQSTVAAVLSDPAGWVNVMGVAQHLNAGAALGLAAFYHWVTSGEAAAVTTTYGATMFQGTETGAALACAVRGVNTTTPIHQFNAAGDASSGTVTPHVIPALTGAKQPTATGCLVIGSVAKDATGTYTNPTGWTFRASFSTNQGRWLGQRDTLTTAGVDVAATNITPNAGDEYTAITIALNPI